MSNWYFSLFFGFPDVIRPKLFLKSSWSSSTCCNVLSPSLISLKILNEPLNPIKFIGEMCESLKW